MLLRLRYWPSQRLGTQKKMSYRAQYWGRHRVPKIRGGSSGLDASGKKHSGAGGGDSGGQEGEDRWTLRTFRREKLGSIKSQKMWRERTGGSSPNHDDGGSLGQSWVCPLCPRWSVPSGRSLYLSKPQVSGI